ncbi:MAG: nucleotidyltransferase domain-containing protein, partial [Pirellula sp.]
MLGNETLWNVALDCHRALEQANIPHSICGGVAVCLHGYQRNTTDIDIIIRDQDVPRVKDLLIALSFDWDQENEEFRSAMGIPVQFLIAGERAGKD